MRDKVREKIRGAKTWWLVVIVVLAWSCVAVFNCYVPGVLFGSFYEGLSVNPLVYVVGFAVFFLAVLFSVFLFIRVIGG